MNISAISSANSAASLASLQSMRAELSEKGGNPSAPSGSGRDVSSIKKAASQFEAIILRQLLEPTIEPIMNGGLGGQQSAGGGIYGYMLTDTLAGSLAKGGGFGLGAMLEKQLTPRGQRDDIDHDSAVPAKPSTFIR